VEQKCTIAKEMKWGRARTENCCVCVCVHREATIDDELTGMFWWYKLLSPAKRVVSAQDCQRTSNSCSVMSCKEKHDASRVGAMPRTVV
jgi:hypothetical protein